LGNCKKWFKWLALSEQRTRQQFEEKAKEAFSSSVLTIERVRGAAKRQRSYILAYAYLHRGEEAGKGTAVAKEFVDIEKMAKVQRTHRSAENLDLAYIRKLEME
jgi:hypothetical protein